MLISLLRVCVVSLLAFGAVGCATKAFTKPYSTTIREAASSGAPIPSIEEERALFFKQDDVNRAKLVSLIKQRFDNSNQDSNYKIGARDEIEVNVFDVPELNIENLRVQESGFIALPLIGAVKVAGKTEAAVRDELTKRLSSYVKSPQVSVFISHYGSQKIGVMGAVDKPGMYPLKKGQNNILEMISEAGGTNVRAGNLVYFVPAENSGMNTVNDPNARAMVSLQALKPGSSAKTAGIEVYLDSIMGTSGALPVEIPVRGGDMVIVPEAGRVVVDGEVQKPGSFELGAKMSLLGALAASGGITYSAKLDEIEVIREVEFERRAHLILDLEKVARGEQDDVKLRNGDIVRVPSHSGRRLATDTFEGISRIINFGVGGTVNLAP